MRLAHLGYKCSRYKALDPAVATLPSLLYMSRRGLSLLRGSGSSACVRWLEASSLTSIYFLSSGSPKVRKIVTTLHLLCSQHFFLFLLLFAFKLTMVAATQADPNINNEDARSTSSTLVSGEHNMRNDAEAVPEQGGPTAAPTAHHTSSPQIRHGFDQELYEEDIIRFLYFSEKRHDTNAKPNVVVRNALKDWVREREQCERCVCVR